jgi:hypothetical protein
MLGGNALNNIINRLDDATARNVLVQIARSRVYGRTEALSFTPDLHRALTSVFASPPQAGTTSEGDLARQALLLLAEDQATRQAIETMAANPSEARQKFDAGATIALTTAVLFALQTHIRFERDKQGKWTLAIEKKPTNESLLRALVSKLLAFVAKGG